MKPARVLALSSVPREGASARFRVYQYIPALQASGFEVTVSPFYTPEFFRILYRRGHYARKVLWFLRQTLELRQVLARASGFDVLFVHREVLPIGPPLVERALARRKGRPLVYDFDDAVYLPNVSEANRFAGLLKWPQKVPTVIRLSDRIVAGNDHLARYARAHNPAVSVIPTCVDTETFVPRPGPGPTAGPPPVVGWIGSPTTVRYLLPLRDVLGRVARTLPFHVRVSGAGRGIEIPGVSVSNLAWSLEHEVSLFSGCDIGLYPLPDTEWTRGKCGFKAIQFMACGVPVVAAPVGVNREIIQDGVNGFLASTPAEWEEKLARLLSDRGLRTRLGAAGRETVVDRYALAVHAPVLAALFRDVLGGA